MMIIRSDQVLPSAAVEAQVPDADPLQAQAALVFAEDLIACRVPFRSTDRSRGLARGSGSSSAGLDLRADSRRAIVRRKGFLTSFELLVTPTWRASRHSSVPGAGTDDNPQRALLNSYPIGVFTSLFNVTGQPAYQSLSTMTRPPACPAGPDRRRTMAARPPIPGGAHPRGRTPLDRSPHSGVGRRTGGIAACAKGWCPTGGLEPGCRCDLRSRRCRPSRRTNKRAREGNRGRLLTPA
jgi:hypothetical protein